MFSSRRIPLFDHFPDETNARHSFPSIYSNIITCSTDFAYIARYQKLFSVALTFDGDILKCSGPASQGYQNSSSAAYEKIIFHAKSSRLFAIDSIGKFKVFSFGSSSTHEPCLEGEFGNDCRYSEVGWTGFDISKLSNQLVGASGFPRLINVFDMKTLKPAFSSSFNTLHVPTDVKYLNCLSENAFGIAEKHQISLWDIRSAVPCIHRLETNKKSTLLSFDSNSTCIVAGGYDKNIHCFDIRKMNVKLAVSSGLKYEVTSVNKSMSQESLFYCHGSTDSELSCVSSTAETMGKASLVSTTSDHQDEDDSRFSRFDLGFRADSRWLGLACLPTNPMNDMDDYLVGISSKNSLYLLNHAQNIPR